MLCDTGPYYKRGLINITMTYINKALTGLSTIQGWEWTIMLTNPLLITSTQSYKYRYRVTYNFPKEAYKPDEFYLKYCLCFVYLFSLNFVFLCKRPCKGSPLWPDYLIKMNLNECFTWICPDKNKQVIDLQSYHTFSYLSIILSVMNTSEDNIHHYDWP